MTDEKKIGISQPQPERTDSSEVQQGTLGKLRQLLGLKQQVVQELTGAGVKVDSVALQRGDTALLDAARQLAGTESSSQRSGMVAPPLDRLPSQAYVGSYTEGRKRVKEDGLQQLKEQKNSSFDNSTWTAVVQKLEASDFPQKDEVVANLMAALEEQVQRYAEIRRQIASGQERKYKTGFGKEEEEHTISSQEQLTPRIFVEHFSSWPAFFSDIQGYSQEQLAQLRQAVGVSEFFQNGTVIHAKDLFEVPRDPKKIQLGKVYKVVEEHSGDNSNLLFRENLAVDYSRRMPIVRNVVYFEDPKNPGQIVRYYEDGVARDQYAFNFSPARVHLEPINPNPGELTISYIEHHTK